MADDPQGVDGVDPEVTAAYSPGLQPPGPGWWKASDGNWYPPESAPVPERKIEPSPAAGWYADPYDSSTLRWWNGTGWTEHLHELPQPILPTDLPKHTAAKPQAESTDAASAFDTSESQQPFSDFERAESVEVSTRSRRGVPALVTGALVLAIGFGGYAIGSTQDETREGATVVSPAVESTTSTAVPTPTSIAELATTPPTTSTTSTSTTTTTEPLDLFAVILDEEREEAMGWLDQLLSLIHI